MPSSKFRVAICGGGVGGLICAVALSRYPDINVDIYEAADAFTEIGAGIGVWPRDWKILCSLGLEEDLRKIAIVPPTNKPQPVFHFRKGDQPEGVSFYTLSTLGGLLPFHRAEFHNVLLQHVGARCNKHTRKRLISYSQSSAHQSRFQLEFEDGSSASCDILIGADGVKSAVRNCMVEELANASESVGRHHEAEEIRAMGPAKWSGMLAYRTLIPADKLRQRYPDHRVLEQPMLYLAKNSQLTVYPIACGTFINFAGFRAHLDRENTTFPGLWVQDVPIDDFLAKFDMWEPEVRSLLQCVERVSRWAVNTTLPLPTFISGRAALLGDAAHAMMPFQGAGAGQAIEDAYILATVLGDSRTTLDTVERALRIYDVVRRPHALRVQEVSRENGIVYSLNYPGLTFDHPASSDPHSEDARKLTEIHTRIENNWNWAWTTTIDGDVERAMKMFDDPSF